MFTLEENISITFRVPEANLNPSTYISTDQALVVFVFVIFLKLICKYYPNPSGDDFLVKLA